MPAPLEVFAAGNVDVYLAPSNTADPVINVAPPGAWIKLGVAGSLDYAEEGVSVRKATEENKIYGAGGYGVRKVFRTREDLTITVRLMDATLEAYQAAFNQVVITTLAGPPAEKTIPLVENVATPVFRALLLRAPNSPYMDGGSLQWWIPIVYQTGDIDTVYRKSDPVVLELEFTSIQDATNGMGKSHMQTA